MDINKQFDWNGYVVDELGQRISASIELFDTRGNKTREQTDAQGRYSLALGAGTARVVFSKGHEYERMAIDLKEMAYAQTLPLQITLKKGMDIAARGWYAGDLHQHSNHSSDGNQSVAEIYLSNLANGLRWAALTDHNTVSGVREWMRLSTHEPFVSVPGIEVTTDSGHYNVWGMRRNIGPDMEREERDLARILAKARQFGGTVQVNHPTLRGDMGFGYWPMIEKFDTMEIWNGKGCTNTTANLEAKEVWFALLNNDIYIPATGGSDNHDIRGAYKGGRTDATRASRLWQARGLYSGMPTTFAYLPKEEPEADALLAAVCRGNSFITNGPLALFDIDGAIPGERLPRAPGKAYIAKMDLYDNRGLDRCVLIKNGKVLETFRFAEEQKIELSCRMEPEAGDWYVVELYGIEGGYAITNPVFVD